MSDLTAAALALHKQGLHVFPADHPGQPHCIGLHDPVTSPCDGTRGKHPAVKFGTWAAAATPKMIDLAWTRRGGVANIAVACGPSNLVVLDEDAVGELDRWCACYGISLPDTCTVTTDRGRHFYFRWDHSTQRIGNSPKAMNGYKIDVRGHGGFAIGEGSQHESGATYTGNGQPIADLPQQVADLLLAGAPAQPSWEHVTRDPNAAMIADGKRHDALVAYAGRLLGKALDYHEAEPSFHARWLLCEQPEGQIPKAKFHTPTCRYPVTWDEAEAKLADVFGRYPAGGSSQVTGNSEAGAGSGQAASGATNTGGNIKAFKLPDGLQATDIGNAARLIRDAGHELRYVHAWGKRLVYKDGRWILDEKDALVTEIAKSVSAELFQLAANTAVSQGKKEAKPVWAWALRSCTAGGIAAMIKLARGMPGVIVAHEQLDSDPWLLNVANGTVALRTGTLQNHNPDDLCTMQVPVTYDPKAVAPLWDKCLETWQPDAAVLDYLQTRAGAGATGIPTETVDIDYGEGGNGKSKFHGAVQHVLGPYATVPHKSLLVAGRYEQHPTVIAKLFRKRLAVASETSAAEALNEEQVKNLTGGDRLEGRRMREDPWEFWPTHTLVMFSNHKPAIRGRDEGVWRRLRLVPWQVTIPAKDRDEHLLTKLQAEATGILRWIVDGAVRFHREGLDPPAAVLTATSEYRKSEDIIGRFCDEVLDFHPNVFCHSIDIKNELEEWCEEQSIEPPRMNDVAAILRQRGCKDGGRKKIHGKRSTIWHGVCVTQNAGKTP